MLFIFRRKIILGFFQIILLSGSGSLVAQETITTVKHKEGILENLFGPGDEEFVCYNKVHRNFYTGIFALVVCLAIAIYGRYRIKKSMASKLEIKNSIIEEKNRDITDSITYAKHLQEAILPPINRIGEHFIDSFILYKPKDIVAGDFYWFETLEDWTFIAAADCTGHGVPGAMVSVVCSNALNRAVKEFGLRDTGKILDKTRELVIETFAKSSNKIADGMDISLLGINKSTSVITWSGANNPLWYIENNGFKEIKANKQSIGKTDNPTSFTTHSVKHIPGTLFYLFTDGYADQFGGSNGKKFKYKQLEGYILANSEKPLVRMHKILSDKFEEWKGDLQQIDDVTIIGIKV
jgi:serine phosphatase RsbU (regulator of sigma subunit)